MPFRVVITGGPSAGKTTLLNLIEQKYRQRVAIVPEAASILFDLGHARPTNSEEALLTQKKIYSLQRELEAKAAEYAFAKADPAKRPSIFCDRGSLDGSAYFPGTLHEFCAAMGTHLQHEIERYEIVIHLQTAEEGKGYTNTMIRTETPAEAQHLDELVARYWSLHPNYIFVPNKNSFEEKLAAAFDAIAPYLPQSSSKKEDLFSEPILNVQSLLRPYTR